MCISKQNTHFEHQSISVPKLKIITRHGSFDSIQLQKNWMKVPVAPTHQTHFFLISPSISKTFSRQSLILTKIIQDTKIHSIHNIDFPCHVPSTPHHTRNMIFSNFTIIRLHLHIYHSHILPPSRQQKHPKIMA